MTGEIKTNDNEKLLKLKNIKPYPGNIKIHTKEQINFIKESIIKDGYLSRIIVGKDNYIVAGHCRYLAFCEIDPTKEMEIKVRDISHLPKDQIDKIRIKDNTSAIADFDYEKFEIELNSLYDDIDNEISSITEDLMIDDTDIKEIKKANRKKKKNKFLSKATSKEKGTVKHRYKCPKCKHEWTNK